MRKREKGKAKCGKAKCEKGRAKAKSKVESIRRGRNIQRRIFAFRISLFPSHLSRPYANEDVEARRA